ncbi:MAG: hypothetical protein J6P19_06030 [Acetobacter sp.]|nr:hypothetical protein [Acetobacter sp.]
MIELKHEVITDFVNGNNTYLIQHMDQVKERWGEFDIFYQDFKEIYEKGKEYQECDFCDFYDNFGEELFCESWQGYPRMIRETWQELNDICRGIGIFGNGKNEVFNRLYSVICWNISQQPEKADQFQEYKDLILEILWVRRLVGAVMVRVGLI